MPPEQSLLHGPTREHNRRSSVYIPSRRSQSQDGRRIAHISPRVLPTSPIYRVEHRGPRRKARSPDDRARLPFDVLQREDRARARALEQALAEREMARADAQISQLRAERDRVRQDRRRQAEVTRLDREIETRQVDYQQSRRRRRALNAVVHNDPYDEDHRGRSPGVLRNLFRMSSRSSGPSLSEVRPGTPQRRRERVVYDDHPRRGYRRFIDQQTELRIEPDSLSLSEDKSFNYPTTPGKSHVDHVHNTPDEPLEVASVCNFSFQDSGYYTSSEVSSVNETKDSLLEARDELVRLFLSLDYVHDSFEEASRRFSSMQFEKALRGLVRQFAHELGTNTTVKAHVATARFVSLYSGFVVNYMSTTYFLKDEARYAALARLSEESPNIKSKVERYLSSLGPEPPEASTKEAHPNQSDELIELDQQQLPHLEQLRAFLLQSSAMKNFQQNVQSWAKGLLTYLEEKPECEEVIDSEVTEYQSTAEAQISGEKPKDEHIIEKRANEERLTSDTRLREEEFEMEKAVEERTFPIPVPSGHQASHGLNDAISSRRWLYIRAWLKRNISREISRILRPVEQPGYRRLEWLCVSDILPSDCLPQQPVLASISLWRKLLLDPCIYTLTVFRRIAAVFCMQTSITLTQKASKILL